LHYLALWVLIDHVMGYSGFDDDGTLGGLAKLLTEGKLAVDLFMVLSGFVILRLLDKREENYGQFICRRFFRLYPLFVLLFLLAIPLTRLDAWSLAHSGQWMRPGATAWFNHLIDDAWQYWPWNIPLHLTLLHGLAGNDSLGDVSIYAFLAPAWSISLEWQFYLVAPLAYWLATGNESRRFVLCALCALLYYAGLNFDWGSAFLPLNVGFFFIGVVSYFAFKSNAFAAPFAQPRDGIFPVACAIAAMLFLLCGKQRIFIPIGLWIIFLGLLNEHPASRSAKVLLPFFTNPVAQYLGRISYSIYLSHQLLIIIFQAALALWLPHLGKVAHFGALLTATLAGTIAVSALLYRFVEAPGMKLGAALAVRRKPVPEIKYAI
jgi:peptidoglycan/LPS O-acetylase OafA/YrhL